MSALVSRGPRLDRRTLLRGALGGLGVTVALPALDLMLDGHGEALADAGPGGRRKPPRRFGVFYWGGGVVHTHWNPRTAGPITATGWQTPDSLEPFARELRPYLTIVTGTNHQNSSPGHIPARGIALSSSHDLDTTVMGVGTFRGQSMPEPTIDALAAEAWQGRTLFDSVEVGICRKGPYRSNISWKRGGRTYNRHETSPQRLFDRLFGRGTGSVLAASAALDKSILDGLRGETESLLKRVGKRDQRRLEQHLEGLRGIERRLQERERLARSGADTRIARCSLPDRPEARDYGDGTGHEEKEAKSRIMSDLVATALACDLTRVFSYEFSAGQSHAVYWEVGVAMEHHPLTHKEAKGGTDLPKVTKFIMKNFAYLAARLREMPEGAGNVLDHTVILATSEHANAGKHDYTDHPFLLVGKAGGALRAGQHWRDPDPAKNRTAPRVLLTALRAAGVPIERVGQGTGGEGNRVAAEPLSELLV